jgi:hypothetical protein
MGADWQLVKIATPGAQTAIILQVLNGHAL